MSKTLLISPRSQFLENDFVMPPLGIMYLKSALNHYGYEAELEDNFKFESPWEYKDVDFFGVSCVTPQRDEAKKILDSIKSRYPGKKVILGGPHASKYTDECLKEKWDYIIKGDGEKSLLKIVSAKNLEERVLNNPLTLEEMNAMPRPHRGKDFLNNYKYLLDGELATTIMTSRGCPQKCKFCESAGEKPRYYTPGNLHEEMKSIVQLGYRRVQFFDDLFAISLPRVQEMTKVIKPFHDYIDLKFRCFGHAKFMTPEMAKELASAGCTETGVGFESGAQRILDYVKRPAPTRQQQEDYIKICNDAGMRVKAFFMLGLPHEDKESIYKTESLINKLLDNHPGNNFDLVVYSPYKGTNIRDSIDQDIAQGATQDQILQKHGLCFENLDKALGYYKGKHGATEHVVRTIALTSEEIIKERDRIFNKYNRTYQK